MEVKTENWEYGRLCTLEKLLDFALEKSTSNEDQMVDMMDPFS